MKTQGKQMDTRGGFGSGDLLGHWYIFMNIKRAGKQSKAFWRSQEAYKKIWVEESTDYQRLMNLERGHAAGWTAGVAWAKKNIKAKWPNEKS